jgi:hypothetical protein
VQSTVVAWPEPDDAADDSSLNSAIDNFAACLFDQAMAPTI